MTVGVRYLMGAVVVTMLAVVLGIQFVGPDGRLGVVVGGAIGLLLQVVSFWVLAVLLFPQRRLLVFGVGLLVRLLAIVLAALLLVPALGLPLAPTLLTLIAVFLLTNLLEPVVLHLAPGTGR